MIPNSGALRLSAETVDSSTVFGYLTKGAFAQALSCARKFATSRPSAESDLLAAVCAKWAGETEAVESILNRASEKYPEHTGIQVVFIANEVESGRFSSDPSKVATALKRNLDFEHPLVSLYQCFIGTEGEQVNLNVSVFNHELPWPLARNFATIQYFDELYQWIPRFHNSTDNVDTFYANYTKYAKYNDGRNVRQKEFYSSRLALRDGMTVLDAGCGTGTLLKALGEVAAINPYGVDVSAGAKTHFVGNVPNGVFTVADLTDLPFDSEKFDLIVTTDTLEHALKPAKAVQELVRVAKPGSQLAISVPDGRFDSYIGHINFFSAQSLRSLLEDYGDVKIEHYFDGIFALLSVA